VLGAGSWGTAFAKLAADAGRDVTLWGRRSDAITAMAHSRVNDDYLPGTRLPDGIRPVIDAAEALDGAGVVALAVPSQTLRANLADWRSALPTDALVVSLIKGIELGSSLRMSEVICDASGVDPARVCVLSGPNLAREIAAEQPAAAVVACTEESNAEQVQHACAGPYFRPYTNSDVIGCEVGGTVKNVIALACGMAEGLGFGDNTRASLITRGLAETARLGVALGADPLTFAGLAGMGDLVGTCTSPLSRNRTFGELLGRGKSLAEVVAATTQTAEGVQSCLSVQELAHRHGIDMPITEHVVRVCHEGMRAADMVGEIMGRQVRSE